MPKAKGKTWRQKFGYSVNRKRLNRNARLEGGARIDFHIRQAWDHGKSVRQNLAEMGLAMDPNKAVPLRKRKAEASLPEKEGNTLPRDLAGCVRCCVVEIPGEGYKPLARDEKYYQDIPKQICNKINACKRFPPAEWQAATDFLQENKMEVE